MTRPTARYARPYSIDELSEIASQMSAVVDGKPGVVGLTVVLMNLGMYLHQYDAGEIPAPLVALSAAVEELLPKCASVCLEGPYDRLLVM